MDLQAVRLVAKLRALMDLSALVNSTMDSAEIQQRALEAAADLVDAERGRLLLIDPDTGELRFQVALGETGEEFREFRIPKGQGIAGLVADTGRALVINDVASHPRHLQMTGVTQYETRSMVCVPVRSRGRLIGVLEAVNKKYGEFDDNDLDLLTALGHQVAVAIENSRLYNDLKQSFFETATTLADMIERRDPYTGGHTRRVMQHALATGIAMGIPEEEISSLHLSAILHDIGKVCVSDAVLTKPGRLDDKEWCSMKEHAKAAAEILERVKGLREVIPGVRAHHERLDGSGYPDGLSGEEIPLQARIIAVADAYDAMTTDRPYRAAMSRDSAVTELRRCSGTQFDARVVEAFVSTLPDRRRRTRVKHPAA